MPSIMFDAIGVDGGEAGAKALAQSGDARHFVLEAFKHLKAIAAARRGA
jgi:catalase